MTSFYRCTGRKGMKPMAWLGEIRSIYGTSRGTELQVDARGSYFHIILGKHMYGNYVCVPNWGIGTELAEFTNREWNMHQLLGAYPKISKVDLVSIVDAIYAYGKSLQVKLYDPDEDEEDNVLA